MLKLHCWGSVVPPASPVALGRGALPKLPRLCPSAPHLLCSWLPWGLGADRADEATTVLRSGLSGHSIQLCCPKLALLQAACFRWAPAFWVQRADSHVLRIFVIGTCQAARCRRSIMWHLITCTCFSLCCRIASRGSKENLQTER